MITRRSLLGMTFGGAVTVHLPALPQSGGASTASPSTPSPADSLAATPPPPVRVILGAHGRACKVEVAGVDISHLCRSALVYAEAGDVTRLKLDLLVLEGSEILVEPGVLDIEVHQVRRRLRFEADAVRVKADV